MSRLTDLISKAKAIDPQLGTDMEREFRALSSRLSFGLNFERHKPEAVELSKRSIRRGDKVRVLPPRGSKTKGDQRLWQVKGLRKREKEADLEWPGSDGAESQTVALDDLVVVAKFGDTIYPGLIPTGKVSRGKDKPYHTIINGENYHVLKALTWTHRGKVDVIYIDPPYNTGAKDWKYNNNYVEGEDLYRHSKWLAMMERRLLVAKELLNPENSVLIVTIDEKEYLRLGLLLEQILPEATIQMVSIVINRKGNPRRGEFSRCEEYIYFVRFGGAGVFPWSSDMLHETEKQSVKKVRWKSLLRLASTGKTEGRFNLFYPLFFDSQTLRFLRAGEPVPEGVDIATIEVPKGESVLWPISKNGSDGRWSVSIGKFNEYIKKGFIKFGRKNGGGRTPYYLMSGQLDAIKRGDLQVVGRDEDGAVLLNLISNFSQPMTIWNKQSHSTSGHGTTLLRDLLPQRKFPYPKSLYAVEDAIRFFVANKPNAVVLDYFSGSGTTAHAMMRLNKQDGGTRQCISVTNNEVGADEQKALRKQYLRPGDPEWEKLGICDYITKPRVEAAITGKTPDEDPIKGDYKFTDEFPMADGFNENAEFFTLTYETPLAVSYQTAFARIAPLLWLRAGSVGRRIDKLPSDGWDVANAYGLLVELDKAIDFLKAVRKVKTLRIAYIVTDDERRFQALARRLTEGVEAIRLYESYLTNFAFANGDDV